MSDEGFAEHRRSILGGIQELSTQAKDLAKEQARASAATDAALARVVVRLDDLGLWRVDLEKRLREDIEKRLREVESTRSQLLAVAAVGSLLFGVLASVLVRVIVR